MTQPETATLSEFSLGHSIQSRWACRFIEENILNSGTCWKWPLYEKAIEDGSLFSPDTKLLGGDSGKLKAKARSLATAGFIEWKYYSVLSDGFHGIVGFSLYNPKQKLSRIAEGGMLAIISGRVTTESGTSSDLVWMELFPEESLQGSETETMTAKSNSSHFKVFSGNEFEEIELSTSEGIELKLKMSKQLDGPKWSPKPIFGTDVNNLPSGHWLVDNKIPVGQSTGEMKISAEMIASLSKKSEFNPSCFWKPLSTNSANTEKQDQKFSWTKAPAYFEHSYGVHPLPSQGWDFMFAPMANEKGGATLQSYKGSKEMTRVDIFWTEKDETEPTTVKALSTSFVAGQTSIDWQKSEFNRSMNAWIPKTRVITGLNDDYQLELTNNIEETLPFLRPQTAAVRCFFIGEQLATTSWTLKNREGKVIASAENVKAGGEVAYGRFPSLGKLIRPFPVK